MACTTQTLLNVATLPQHSALGSAQRRVGAQCTAPKTETRCSVGYASSASRRLQVSSKSYLSGTQLRTTARRPTTSKRSSVVTANWKSFDFAWNTVTIASKTEEGGLYTVILDVGEEIVQGYTKPGQFLELTVHEEHKAAFLAIASAPGTTTSHLELLVKPVPGSTAAKLCELPVGASVEIGPVMGKGFDVKEVPGADTILIFATGTGISPIRALIEASPENGGLDAANKKDVRLYYGAQKKENMAFQDKFEDWTANGVQVVPVFSQEDESLGKRYVQDVFIEQQGGPIVGNPETTAVVLCGQKEMAEAVKAMCEAAGIPPENFLTNF